MVERQATVSFFLILISETRTAAPSALCFQNLKLNGADTKTFSQLELQSIQKFMISALWTFSDTF